MRLRPLFKATQLSLLAKVVDCITFAVRVFKGRTAPVLVIRNLFSGTELRFEITFLGCIYTSFAVPLKPACHLTEIAGGDMLIRQRSCVTMGKQVSP